MELLSGFILVNENRISLLILSLNLSDYSLNCLYERDKCMSPFNIFYRFHITIFCVPTLILQDFNIDQKLD